MRRVDPVERLERVADETDRLAALVTAGAAPAAAWRALALAAGADTAALAAEVAAAADLGEGGAPAFAARDEAWRRVGALTVVAVEVGAPLAAALRRAADGLRATAAMHRAVRTAVAGPAANARITMALPVGTAVLGEALGFDVLRVLTTSAIGWAALTAAAALLALAALWTRRTVHRATSAPWAAGLREELVALAVQAGLPLAAARDRAAATAGRVGLVLPAADGLDALAGFADRTGVPVGALLLAEAERQRREVLSGVAERAAALSARLLLPLGLLVLPAFVLVGALPIGLAILSSTALPG